jgi:hypothetical protein
MWKLLFGVKSRTKKEQSKESMSEVGGTRYFKAMAAENKSPGAGLASRRGEWTSANDVFLTGSLPSASSCRSLTKKMAQDSRTEAASLEVVNSLPERIFANVYKHIFDDRRNY